MTKAIPRALGEAMTKAAPRAQHWCGGYHANVSGDEMLLCMHMSKPLADLCPRANPTWEKVVDGPAPLAIKPGDPIAALTAERGAVYGPPSRDFARMAKFWEIVAECPDPLARHALYMIAVKMSRLITTPTHADSWADIQGYGRCGAEVMAEKAP